MVIVMIIAFILLVPIQGAPPPQPPSPPSTFDYAIVAFNWPMAFCATTDCKQQIRPESFRMHGVWPTNGDGSPVNCPTSPFVYSQIKGKASMNTYWPDYKNQNNKDFWKYQWEKHGACSKQSVAEYFENSLALFRKKYNAILTSLRQKDIKPSRGTDIKSAPTVEAVYNAINEGLGLISMLKCNKFRGRVYLLEVQLCAKPDLKSFCDCPPSGKEVECGNPGDKILFYQE